MAFLRPLLFFAGREEFEKVWGKLTEQALYDQTKCLSVSDMGLLEIPPTSPHSDLRRKSVEAGS